MRVTRHNRGFTLIELLVVIAIIGILAAIVFPVFARARESARKAVCLSNMKNIALAYQMYMADSNDTLFPTEHRQEAYDFFSTQPGGGGFIPLSPAEGCYWTVPANPYLKIPVMLDEYVKNRDVWRCPSARAEQGAHFIVGEPDWLAYYKKWQGQWGWDDPILPYGGPCFGGWPAGWGGEVTDSCLQGMFATTFRMGEAKSKAFAQSIGTRPWLGWARGSDSDLKLASVSDPTWYIICGDLGVLPAEMMTNKLLAPDVCFPWCCSSPDWENCPWSVQCGFPDKARTDLNEGRKLARHFGGANLGFLDGHVAWFSQGQITANAARWPDGYPPSSGGAVGGQFIGLEPGIPTTVGAGPDKGADVSSECGIPPLW